MTIPGFGPLAATALRAAIGRGEAMNNGRDLAAYLGLVPRQDSTGGRTRLLGISKRGDRYLRTLLIHGARAALPHLGQGHRSAAGSEVFERAVITMSPSSRSPTSSPGSPGPCSQAGARSKLKRPPRPERRTDIARHVAPHNSPRLRAGTRRDGLAFDRRPENLGGSMSCRRRRIYEDRDARISILAPENTASEIRPDTLPQTVHPPSTIPLHTRGGPYIEPATFRL